MPSTARMAPSALEVRTIGTIPTSEIKARISFDVMTFHVIMWLDTPAKPGGEKPPPRVTVVVVSRNRAPCCGAAWNPSRNPRAQTLQIVVVDNGSSDGSAQLDADFPQTQFIRLPKNFGLTKP